MVDQWDVYQTKSGVLIAARVKEREWCCAVQRLTGLLEPFSLFGADVGAVGDTTLGYSLHLMEVRFCGKVGIYTPDVCDRCGTLTSLHSPLGLLATD